jgi:hypothetical protein
VQASCRLRRPRVELEARSAMTPMRVGSRDGRYLTASRLVPVRAVGAVQRC